MDDAANLGLLVALLESARQGNLPTDPAARALQVWNEAVSRLKLALPTASPPEFSSVDQNLLNAFIDAAQVTPYRHVGDVVREAQIAVLTAPGGAEHYQLLLLIEIAKVARSDQTLTWQEVFIQGVENVGLNGLEPQLIMEWNIDMNVVDAFIRQMRTFPTKSIADALAEAKNSVVYDPPPSKSDLFEANCGHQGFLCCKDPIDSCREPDLLCDWDGLCHRNLWPPVSAYSVNQTVPGEELDTDWTEEVQGLATDGRFWYVVQDKRMWKVPFGIDWTEDWGPLDWEALGIKRVDNGSFATQCRHWGDPDVFNGRVYVPLEECPDESGGNSLAEFDANTLQVTGMRPTRTANAASVAIHPKTGEFYINSNFNSPGLLHVYGQFGDLGVAEPRKIILGTPPGTSIQGIAFSRSGKLYVACDGADGAGGVYAFQVSPNKATLQRYLCIEEHPGAASPRGSGEEMEGITVRDVTWTDETRNQIHVFLLHNIDVAKDNAWFKHIGISDTRV